MQKPYFITLLKIQNIVIIRILFPILFVAFFHSSNAQQITGVWKGKIDKKNVEVKIIQNGDSLAGTSYYYESENIYRRYTIKGYFDAETNSAVWWDDLLVDERKGKNILSTPGRLPLLSRADFNCPGEGRMFLDGKAALKEKSNQVKGAVNLEKIETSAFSDEWDFIIDNFIAGTNDPYIIDSVSAIAYIPGVVQSNGIVIEKKEIVTRTDFIEKKIPTIQEVFLSRKNVLTKEIPVNGDSLELRFYDNAEIDGDSISLFLNDKLIFQHVRLAEKAFIFKLAVSELKEKNELVMLAENLGAIPPNTSYMVAIVGEKRYEANLASDANVSAMINFVKR
jgi:hypothetical protein